MRDFFLLCGRIMIIVGVLLHMAAVFLVSIPAEAHDPLSTALKQYALPHAVPYLELTMQWQRWNLFAPDPSQTLTVYTISARMSPQDDWHYYMTLEENSFSNVHSARIFKMMEQLEDGNLSATFIQRMCRELQLPAQGRVRIVVIDRPVDSEGLADRRNRLTIERDCLPFLPQ